MAKLILLISLVPTILAIVVRKFFCDRGLRSAGDAETSRTGRELATMLLEKAGLSEKVEVLVKRRPEVKVEPAKLILSKHLEEAKNVIALGEVALLCGHALVAVKNPELLKWRQWAVKFSWAFPVFTLVILVFAIVVARMPPGWGISVAAAALGLGSGMSLASLQIEIQGARMMATIVDE
ncbi:MAG: zinc metallopeptidase, partial [Roseibacillus sp.]